MGRELEAPGCAVNAPLACRMSGDRGAFFLRVLDHPAFARDGLLFGSEPGKCGRLHWVVLDPRRHTMFAWRKTVPSYPEAARRLGIGVHERPIHQPCRRLPGQGDGEGRARRGARHRGAAHRRRRTRAALRRHYEARVPLGHVSASAKGSTRRRSTARGSRTSDGAPAPSSPTTGSREPRRDERGRRWPLPTHRRLRALHRRPGDPHRLLGPRPARRQPGGARAGGIRGAGRDRRRVRGRDHVRRREGEHWSPRRTARLGRGEGRGAGRRRRLSVVRAQHGCDRRRPHAGMEAHAPGVGRAVPTEDVTLGPSTRQGGAMSASPTRIPTTSERFEPTPDEILPPLTPRARARVPRARAVPRGLRGAHRRPHQLQAARRHAAREPVPPPLGRSARRAHLPHRPRRQRARGRVVRAASPSSCTSSCTRPATT